MFTKKAVIVILSVSISWVYLSFILAFMGKDQIAETIAVTAITSIIATFFAYSAKALFEKRESFGAVGKVNFIDEIPTHIKDILEEETDETDETELMEDIYDNECSDCSEDIVENVKNNMDINDTTDSSEDTEIEEPKEAEVEVVAKAVRKNRKSRKKDE